MIDSGASESDISEMSAPQYPLDHPQEAGVAPGTPPPTELRWPTEDNNITFSTSEGHLCVLTMQVTDVHRPLVSMSRLCDAGHRVIVTSGGGHIEHDASGQTTPFYRGHNIYRMGAQTMEPEIRFSWQEK